MMRVTRVPLKLDIADCSTITMETNDKGEDVPVISMNFDVKIPVMNLLSAMSDFRDHLDLQHEAPPAMTKPQTKTPPAMLGGPPPRVAPPPSAATFPAAPATPIVEMHSVAAPSPAPSPPPPEVPRDRVVAAVPPPAPPEVPREVDATWETDIAALQANYEEYAAKVKWQVDNTKTSWVLDNVDCLKNFEPVPLEPSRLQPSRPGSWPDNNAPAVPERAARISVPGPPPSAAPPPVPERAARTEMPGPPPSGPPPPVPMADMNDPPPGLTDFVVPVTACPPPQEPPRVPAGTGGVGIAGAALSVAAVAAVSSTDGAGSEDKKECKQQ